MLPRLPTDRIVRTDARLAHKPVVIITDTAGTRRVAATSIAAERAGARVGMTLAQARALAPEIQEFTIHPAEDQAEREAIAATLARFSPIVSIYDDITIVLDLTGCERAHGGLFTLIRAAAAAITARGYEARCAVAPSPTAARALAMFTKSFGPSTAIPVVEAGGEIHALGPLPPASLQIDPETAGRLNALGITTITQLAHLPRAALAARFGPTVLLQMDRALSTEPEALRPFQAVELPAERMEPPAPIDRPDMVLFILKKLADSIALRLEALARGARSLECVIERPGGAVEKINIQLSSPRRAGTWIFSLLKTRFERVDLGQGVSAITLRVTAAELLRFGEPLLFEDGEPGARQDLHALLDRLAARLGEENVGRVELVGEYRPEYCYKIVPAAPALNINIHHKQIPASRAAAGQPAEPAFARAARPLRLYKSPKPVELRFADDGVPAHIRSLQLEWREIARAAGPERIQAGWWEGRAVDRVYWIIELVDGARYWVFHDPAHAGAFVHGEFC